MLDPLWILMFGTSLTAIVVAQGRQERVTRAGLAALAATVLVLAMVIVETLIDVPIDPVFIISLALLKSYLMDISNWSSG